MIQVFDGDGCEHGLQVSPSNLHILLAPQDDEIAALLIVMNNVDQNTPLALELTPFAHWRGTIKASACRRMIQEVDWFFKSHGDPDNPWHRILVSYVARVRAIIQQLHP